MALARTLYVTCDRCAMERSMDAATSSAARRLAKRQGWTRRKDAAGKLIDIGPVCRAAEHRREAG